jgi:RNA recognition motif-containing protein
MVKNQTTFQHNANGLTNENPTPLEIKEQMANRESTRESKRKIQENTENTLNGSDQENQKPNGKNNETQRKPKQKGTKQKISLTPFFKGRDSEVDSERDKFREIFGIKGYSPFEQEKSQKSRENNSRNNHRRRLENDEIPATEKIFVGKLPLNATQQELFNHFAKFGSITEAIIKDNRGFGFVTFESISEAEAALDPSMSHSLMSHPTIELEVKRALPNRFQNSMSHQGQSSHSHQSQNGTNEQIQTAIQTTMTHPYLDYSNIQYTYPIFCYPPPPNQTSIIEEELPLESRDENDSLMTHQTQHATESDCNPTTSKHHSQRSPNSNENQENDFAQQKKLFIGGLHWKTQDSDLREYFSKKGTVTDAMVIMEPTSQRSRGFGFVVFSNAEDAESVFEDKGHEINGKIVDVKRAISKDEDIDNELAHVKVDKIFVGGIRKDTSKDELTKFFEINFGGKVTRVDMKVDKEGQNKGYAFISFDSTEVVDEICQNKYHRIGPHMCEVKKAQSKENGINPNDQNNQNQQHDNNNGYKMMSHNGYYSTYAPETFFGSLGPMSYPAAYSVPVSYSNPYSNSVYDASAVPIPHPGSAVPLGLPPGVSVVTSGSYDQTGNIIGGTWYPKMSNSPTTSNQNQDTSDESQPMSHQPAIYYQTLPYAYPSYPAAYCQPTQTKD